MDKAHWVWVIDSTIKYKGHVIDEALVKHLIEDLGGRAAAEGETLEFTVGPLDGPPHFDEPGMIWAARSVRTVRTGDLVMEVPSEDWFTTHARLKTAPERVFADGTPYYKIHSWRFCVVFTPSQRQEVLQQMEEQMDAAEKEADSDLQRFREAIDAANKNLGREAIVVAPIPGQGQN